MVLVKVYFFIMKDFSAFQGYILVVDLYLDWPLFFSQTFNHFSSYLRLSHLLETHGITFEFILSSMNLSVML